MTASLRAAADCAEIRRLQDAYADLAMRGAWDELPGLLLPDALVVLDTRTQPALEFVGPHALGQFLSRAVEPFGFFAFAVLNSCVTLSDDDPDVAWARMHIMETRCARDTGVWSRAFGVYHDQCARVNAEWRIAGRRYHSLAREPETTIFSYPEDVAGA